MVGVSSVAVPRPWSHERQFVAVVIAALMAVTLVDFARVAPLTHQHTLAAKHAEWPAGLRDAFESTRAAERAAIVATDASHWTAGLSGNAGTTATISADGVRV